MIRVKCQEIHILFKAALSMSGFIFILNGFVKKTKKTKRNYSTLTAVLFCTAEVILIVGV